MGWTGLEEAKASAHTLRLGLMVADASDPDRFTDKFAGGRLKAQGYLFSRPVPATGIASILTAWTTGLRKDRLGTALAS